MSFLIAYIKKYSLGFSAAIFFLTLEAMCDLVQHALLAQIIDVGITNNDLSYILNIGAIMLGITILGGIFASTRNILASTIS